MYFLETMPNWTVGVVLSRVVHWTSISLFTRKLGFERKMVRVQMTHPFCVSPSGRCKEWWDRG